MAKAFAVFEVRPNGYTMCHFRGKQGGCEMVAAREPGRYVKRLLDCTKAERYALTHFVAFTLQNPNDSIAAEKAVRQIFESLKATA
jgi:hypothetical protein